MTSEIRVNKLTNRIGLSTVTFADSGIGVTVTGRIDPDTDSARDLGTTSVRWRNVYADTLYGDGSNLTGITGTTINNNAGDRLVTAENSANTLNGEANLTFNGQKLNIVANDGGADVNFAVRNTNANGYGAYISGGGSNSNYILRLDDKDQNEYFRVTGIGHVGILNGSPQRRLHIGNSGNAESNIRLQGGADYAEIRVKDSENALSFHFNVGGAGSRELFRSSGSTGLLSINTYSYEALKITTNDNGANGPEVSLIHNSTSPAANDSIGQIRFNAKDSAGNTDTYAYIKALLVDPTSGSEDAALLFATRGSGTFAERARITSDGEFIVGMTAGSGASPDARLQVRGDTFSRAQIQVLSTHNDDNPATLQISKSRSGGNTILGNNDDIGQINFAGNDGNGYHNVGRIMVTSSGEGNGNDDLPTMMRFFTTPNGGVSLTERMRIHSTGLVSVGEDVSNSHDYKFVVKPNRSDSSKAALGLLVDGDSGQGGGVAQEAISAKFVNTNTFNNATHQYAVYITAGQQYTAPVTGCYASAQGLYGQTNVFDGLLQKGVNAATDGITFKSNIVQTGTQLGSTYHMRCYNNSSERLRITLGGNIQNTNNSYGQISDVKHKENIVDANSQWDDIKAIKVRNFNFKESSGFETHKQIGVIAQEIETVSAGLVDTTNDTETDESTGEGKVTGTTKYVKYSILYMKAIKCLQEAQERIEKLEQDNIALRVRVTNLEGN